MFKIKRPVFIGFLLVLLALTVHFNYKLNQEALKRASKDYQKFETAEMEEYNSEQQEEFASNIDENYFDIVDSVDTSEEDVSQVIATTNESIEKAMSKEQANINRSYFVEHRLSRDKLRANLVDRLSEIINNDNTTEAKRSEAQEEIIKIGRVSEQELMIEGLIKSKGFNDTVVFLGEKDIKVVVDSEELSEQDMVKILDIVQSETEYDINNIKIMKKI